MSIDDVKLLKTFSHKKSRVLFNVLKVNNCVFFIIDIPLFLRFQFYKKQIDRELHT